MRSGWPVWLFVFAGGVLAGWLASGWLAEKPPVEEPVVEIHEAGGRKYRYINPVLECANVQWQELRPFRRKIMEPLDQAVSDHRIKEYAVYFRDLNNGWWFGINEKADFQQGSLIKVPLLMAFLRQAEKEPEMLGHKLVCDADPATLIQQNIPPRETLKVGETYTIEDLLRRMIVYSDNAAMDTLVRHTRGEEWFRQTYRDLALPAPGSDNATGEISVKRYASFFRVLFNASYLNRENSNRALKLLTETT
ncbi:MAG: serine hydrolase, partial [Desulfuromonadales bacterium]